MLCPETVSRNLPVPRIFPKLSLNLRSQKNVKVYSYQASVAVTESDANVDVSQPPTTFKSFVTDEY